MKKYLFQAATGLLLTASLLFSACGGSANKSGAQHGDSKEYTSTYVCPMHCDNSGSDNMGKCPVCGMDYVLQNEHVKDGHNH